MCCRNILDIGGDRDFALFHSSQELMTDIDTNWGSHVFDPASPISRKESDPKVANYLEYTNKSNCSQDYKCIIKVSPLETNNYNFYNSHIWPCNTTFNTINMTSICYKPENQTDCTSYEGLCNYQGIRYVDDMWVYCSFGIDDEQIPSYPDEDHEEGGCCAPGEYYLEGIGCIESFDCGFEDPDPLKCYLPDTNPLTGKPEGYFEEEYFDQSGCVNWINKECCCFNIFKYGEPGNWLCPINTRST